MVLITTYCTIIVNYKACMLTKASIYKTQHCFPGRIHSECRSMADLWLYALSKVFASIAPSSSPPLPSNSGEAFAELKEKKQQVSTEAEVQKNARSMGGLYFEKMKLFKNIILHVNLTDFLKTNLPKFAVIWVKRCRKAGYLSPRTAPKSR